MKRNMSFVMIAALFLVPGLSLAQAPQGIGGFVLGSNIADYKEMVNMDTAFPIRYCTYVKEVEINEMEGFKSGLIWYGDCAEPGRIVRIKLKYADSTKRFYEMLFKRFKERFGEPTEWQGDSFHVVLAWKWSFTDSENNHISLILQHNTKDEEEKKGNAVKLTMWNLLEQERLCFENKHPKDPTTSGKRRDQSQETIDWGRFVPR
jgi:hypothetical protein